MRRGRLCTRCSAAENLRDDRSEQAHSIVLVIRGRGPEAAVTEPHDVAFRTGGTRSHTLGLSGLNLCGYSPLMSDKLNALLARLKAHRRTLILAMAEHDGLPAGSALRQVAELENVIAAVDAVAGEEADRVRRV